jgi:hypothetical protein
MTEESIAEQLERIKVFAQAGSDELAHRAEKNLWRRVMTYLRDHGIDENRQLARAALKSQSITFFRHFS